MTSKEVFTPVILLLGLLLFPGCSEEPVNTNSSAAADIIEAEIAGTDLQLGALQEAPPVAEPEIESPVNSEEEQPSDEEIDQELEDLIGPQPQIASKEVEQILRGNSEDQSDAFDREFEDAFEEDSALDILKGRGGNLPSEQISPHVTIPPVSDDKYALLLDSIFSQKLFDYRSQLGFRWYKGFIISGEIIGGNPWAEWHLNKVNNVGDVHRVIIRFEHPEHIGSEEEIASSYYVDLLFHEERASVKMDGRVGGGVAFTNVGEFDSYKLTSRHSLPTIKDETGGLRVTVNTRQQHRFFLPGRNGTGMIVVVPATGKYAPRGILLCPRDYDIKRLKAGYRAMDYTGYEMVGAQFQMEGIAQAIVKTGFGPGFVSATMQTTPNIVPSQQVYDSSTTVYPEATVVYVPREGMAIPVAKSKGTINAGFVLSSVLHNSFKHRAESRLEKAVTIKSIDIKTPFALAHRGIQFRVKPGPCYALIKEERGRHTFSKEPLPHRPNDTADLPNTPEELDAFLLGKDSPAVPGEDF